MRLVLHERPPTISIRLACKVLGISKSSAYALQRKNRTHSCAVPPKRSRKDASQPRALSKEESEHVLTTLNRPEYQDMTPYAVFMTLLTLGTYLCSVSTMHRILRKAKQNGERRCQRPSQHHAIPRLWARFPNEVWTWDITKLRTVDGIYLSLYVVLDLYSRYVVAWMVSTKENSALATQLIEEACARYPSASAKRVIHQDRGAPMTARAYLDVGAEIGVTMSHSRPRVSNDNPHSESHFRTMKYRPDFPGLFENVEHARSWGEGHFQWHNFQHCHSRLAGFTPEQVFTGRFETIAVERQTALDKGFTTAPERFVKGAPKVKRPPPFVAINPVVTEEGQIVKPDQVNFPTLSAAKERQPKLY